MDETLVLQRLIRAASDSNGHISQQSVTNGASRLAEILQSASSRCQIGNNEMSHHRNKNNTNFACSATNINISNKMRYAALTNRIEQNAHIPHALHQQHESLPEFIDAIYPQQSDKAMEIVGILNRVGLHDVNQLLEFANTKMPELMRELDEYRGWTLDIITVDDKEKLKSACWNRSNWISSLHCSNTDVIESDEYEQDIDVEGAIVADRNHNHHHKGQHAHGDYRQLDEIEYNGVLLRQYDCVRVKLEDTEESVMNDCDIGQIAKIRKKTVAIGQQHVNINNNNHMHQQRSNSNDDDVQIQLVWFWYATHAKIRYADKQNLRSNEKKKKRVHRQQSILFSNDSGCHDELIYGTPDPQWFRLSVVEEKVRIVYTKKEQHQLQRSDASTNVFLCNKQVGIPHQFESTDQKFILHHLGWKNRETLFDSEYEHDSESDEDQDSQDDDLDDDDEEYELATNDNLRRSPKVKTRSQDTINGAVIRRLKDKPLRIVGVDLNRNRCEQFADIRIGIGRNMARYQRARVLSKKQESMHIDVPSFCAQIDNDEILDLSMIPNSPQRHHE